MMALSMHLLDQDHQNKFDRVICHWHIGWHHIMSTAVLMAPLHLLVQDDQNEILCYANGTGVSITCYQVHQK